MNPLLLQPVVTGDASFRLERLSAVPTSTTWHDISATGNNGTAADAAMFSDFYFDSIVDEVVMGSADPSADFTSDWSIAFWYKRDTSIATGYNTLMQNRVSSPSGGFILRDRTDPAPPADYSFEVVAPYQNTGTLIKGDDANWHFGVVCWHYDAHHSHTIKGYIDGALYLTRTTAINPHAGGPMQIGKGFYYRFSGNMDTVRSYNRALSPDEILRDYHAGKAAHP